MGSFILFMQKIERPYYRTVESGTEFFAQESDLDGVGLEDYRKLEIDAVREFIASSAKIMVIGGVSSTSKTHSLIEIAREQGMHFFDLQSLSEKARKGHNLDQIRVNVGAMINYADHDKRSGNGQNGIILDEGLVLTNEDTSKIFEPIITELLERYSRVIVAGGGSKFTGEEQLNIMGGYMPKSESIAGMVFSLKTMNLDQSSSLIEITNKISYDIAKMIAETLDGYFRLPRVIVNKIHFREGVHVKGGKPLLSYMPLEVYQPLWNRQQKLWQDKGWLKKP